MSELEFEENQQQTVADRVAEGISSLALATGVVVYGQFLANNIRDLVELEAEFFLNLISFSVADNTTPLMAAHPAAVRLGIVIVFVLCFVFALVLEFSYKKTVRLAIKTEKVIRTCTWRKSFLDFLKCTVKTIYYVITTIIYIVLVLIMFITITINILAFVAMLLK